MKKEFTYNWFHVKTGKSGKTSTLAFSEIEFHKMINGWNSTSIRMGGDWIYTWEI